MKKFVTILSLLLMASTAHSQEAAYWAFTYLYDVDDTNPNYCLLKGKNDSAGPGTTWHPSQANLITVGSNATVAALTAGTNPFASMAVGDVISVVRDPQGPLVDTVAIITYTDADNIVVSSEVNWGRATGYPFQWLNNDCGTTADDGWLSVGAYTGKTVGIQFDQGDYTTGIDFSVEGKTCAIGANPIQLFPTNSSMDPLVVATADLHLMIQADVGTLESRGGLNIPEPWCFIRVRISGNGTDSSDAGTAKEEITVWFQGELRR